MTADDAWLGAGQARAEVDLAAVGRAAEAIVANMGRVRLSQTRTRPTDGVSARRDMHARHQGLLQGRFVVLSDLAATGASLGVQLERGVFRAGESYDCWLRYSSGSKGLRSDELPDGRGLGIKLVLDGVPEGEEPLAGPPGSELIQDFVLLNGPAFFARDAAEMAKISELEASDLFSLSHFLRDRNLPGLRAALHMLGTQASSPLDLQYFSQTPYAFGDLVVKYRVRRISPKTVLPVDPYQGPNKLFLALKDELNPTSKEPRSPIVLEFALQFGRVDREAFPVDDATVVWDETKSPFVPVALITLEPQAFDTIRRMDAAERLTFDPWRGLRSHEPLGSINLARRRVYETGAQYRQKMNRASIAQPVQFLTDLGHPMPQDRPALPPGALSARDPTEVALQRAVGLFPRFGSWLYRRALSPSAYAIPALILALLLLRAFFGDAEGPLTLDLTGRMPSEQLIPPAVWSDDYRTAEQRQGLARDPKYVFRYAATGSEYDAGMPYWIFRALPRVAPQFFEPTGGWASFGLDTPDDQEYYRNYHDLPRGFVLSDTVVHLLGTDVKLVLKRVSFNCATCHRGEFEHQDGHRQFIDGMPNHTLDAVAFKLAVYQTFRHPDFNVGNVLAKVGEVLAEERDRASERGYEGPGELTLLEKGVYTMLVRETRRRAEQKPIDWIHQRPENGPGRVDAFGSIRFEFLGHDPALDAAVTTVDLPSIWNQGPRFRRSHHWDGNTRDVRGRNFGAILGVGGRPHSVHRRDVDVVGHWIDHDLAAPPFPEMSRVQGHVERGQGVYIANCAMCHGTYEEGQLLTRPPCMDDPVAGEGTDLERVRAMTPEFIAKFNQFGADAGLWGPRAFEAREGYLCPPLDGIWARAPYLHNGSVPTLDDLLHSPGERPKSFQRGSARYDAARGGFESTSAASPGRRFEYLTSEIGNAATGHDHPIVDDEERRDLIAYLLTL